MQDGRAASDHRALLGTALERLATGRAGAVLLFEALRQRRMEAGR